MKIQQWFFELLRKQSVTDGRTDGRTDNVKTVYPLQTKFAGGIIWVIKETKRYGRTDARTTWKQYTPTNKVCGGYNKENQ